MDQDSNPKSDDAAETNIPTEDSEQNVAPNPITIEITQADETPASQPTEAPIVVTGKSRRFGKKQLIIAAVVVLVIGGALGGYLYKKSSSKKQSNAESTATPTEQATNEPVAQKENELAQIQSVDGSTFYAQAKKLGDQKVFANLAYFGGICDDNGKNCKPEDPSVIEYYEVGTTKDGRRILVLLTPGGLDQQQIFALGKGTVSYEILARMDGTTEDLLKKPEFAKSLADFKQGLAKNVTLNDSIRLADLDFTKELEVNGQKVVLPEYSPPNLLVNGLNDLTDTGTDEKGVSNKKKTMSKLTTVGNKTFYRVFSASSESDTYQLVSIVATLGSSFSVTYQLNGELTKNSTQAVSIDWKSGDKNTTKYFTGGPGCGLGQSYVVANKASKSQLTQIGTSKQGQKLFQLPVTDPIVNELFDKDYNKGEYLEVADLKNLTIQQFADKHAYFIVENGFNELVVLQRDDMFVRGGCAKPVVYLYPTQTTKISVAVGADVTVSDPFYPAGGWKNVLAQPNGKLTYQGKSYDSLFWEGFGHGVYPEITSGLIVPRDQAASTIRTQLFAQGLNDNETQDFLDFWAAKLPTTPYVRLTWLSKQQLDTLAPLAITPRPQTNIRVFLDFEGVTKPYALKAQTLRRPARDGFTMVEWGGLARDGSVPKLR